MRAILSEIHARFDLQSFAETIDMQDRQPFKHRFESSGFKTSEMLVLSCKLRSLIAAKKWRTAYECLDELNKRNNEQPA